MSRDSVRQMRQALSHGLDAAASAASLALAQAAAVQLLARSVGFGHRRLSVLRLSVAAQAGALVPAHHWNYCFGVAASSHDPRIRALFMDAMQAAEPPFDFDFSTVASARCAAAGRGLKHPAG